MKKQIITVLVLISQLSMAAPSGPKYLVRSHPSSTKNYLAQTKANPMFLQVSKALWSQQPGAEYEQILKERIEMAQTSYLQEDKSKAKHKFLEVAQLLHERDWKITHLRILQYAFLRAFELSTSKEEKSRLMSSAASILTVSPDKKIFSPDTLQEFQTVRTSLGKVSLQFPNKNLEGFEYIGFHGQLIPIHRFKRLSLPKSHLRMTAYSSGLESQVFLGTPNNFKTWKPKLSPLASGDCKESKIAASISFEKELPMAIYHSDKCIKDLGSNKNLALGISPSRFHRAKTASGFNTSIETSSYKSEKKWWHNKWLWIGLAAGATTYLVLENQRDSGSSGGGQGAPGQGGTSTTTYE